MIATCRQNENNSVLFGKYTVFCLPQKKGQVLNSLDVVLTSFKKYGALNTQKVVKRFKSMAHISAILMGKTQKPRLRINMCTSEDMFDILDMHNSS